MFSIVIVNWRLPELTQRCVDSIHKYSYFKNMHEIIVVHNEWDNKTKINGVDHEFRYYENVGLSKAANQGAKFASKNFICLIDNDVEVMEQWDISLLYSKEFKPESNWTCSTMVEPKPSSTNVCRKKFIRYGFMLFARDWYKQISNTPLLIPKKFWEKIGGYDEDFPNVGAELGLAKRAYDHGERWFLQSNSMVFHHQSQSMDKLSTINEEKKQRDITFKNKYGITRKQFIKLIGKGEKYNTDG